MSRVAPAVWLAAALLAPTPGHALDVHTNVSGRVDTRVRTPLPGDTATTWFTADLEVLPSGEIAFIWSSTRFAIQYNPSFLWREPQRGGRAYFLNRGRATFTQRFSRATLALQQDAAYGSTDVSVLSPGDTPAGTVGAGQSLGAIPYERFASTAVFDSNPTDRVGVTLTGGYLISGSPVKNFTLPLQWGPLASGRFRWLVVPRNWLVTGAQYLQARFATGQTQLIASLTESYEHQFSQGVSVSVGGGAAFTKEHLVEYPNGPKPGDYQELLPVALASVSWRGFLAQTPLAVSAVTRLAPFADRFTGTVYERLEGQLTSEWRSQKTVTALGNAGFAYAVPIGDSQQVGDRLFYGEAGARWATQTWLTLAALTRLVWVEQPRLGIAGQLQWLLTLSVTFHDERNLAW